MSSCIHGRIFVVGCPRSGTTLLQSRLAAHPDIATCFETHFFWMLEAESKRLRKWGLADGRAPRRFEEFLRRIERSDLAHRAPRRAIFLRSYVRRFLTILDELALAENKSRWVEKTPDHVLVIPAIERYVPDARFVHIVRDGTDAVASLYEVSRQSPRHWNGHAWSIHECVEKWNHCIRATTSHAGKPNHFVVRYEELVARPAEILRAVCGFLGIAFTPTMVDPAVDVTSKVTRGDRPWIAGVRDPIRSKGASKFLELFDEKQRDDIASRLMDASHLTTGPIRTIAAPAQQAAYA